MSGPPRSPDARRGALVLYILGMGLVVALLAWLAP